jgi:ATP-dependent DNA helicase RecG
MNVSNETLLNHLHLNDGELLKRATALLFHPDPEKYITGAYVKIGYFDSDSELIYQDEIHGNLFQQADKTLDLLFTKYLKAKITYESITRVETFPFPEAALREAVINAIVHKEYSSGVPVQIKVFEHKLIIWNDGQLPLEWTLKDLLTSHPSKPANPDVANAFFRAGMIESWGRGIEKIIHLCVADGLSEPIFNIAFGGLQIEFIARLEPVSNIMEKSEEKSEEKSLAFNLLDSIKHNPKVTTNMMMGSTANSKRSIEYQLNILKESGIITRIGTRKMVVGR